MNWRESDSDCSPLPAKVYIAARAMADAIELWLLDDCQANDDELAREMVEDIVKGWRNPEVEA